MPKKPSPKLEDIFVSIVLITDHQSKDVQQEIRKLSDLVRQRYSNYEIIVVDNRLKQPEVAKIMPLLDELACIRVIRLSRENPRDICVFVGLEAAIGDVVVVCSPHDPIKLIPDFIKKARTSDLVFGISKAKIRHGVANRYGAKLFYWYNKKFLDISIPENSTYYMALSRKAVNSLTHSERFARHIRYLARQIGFPSEELHYQPKPGHFQEKKHLKELVVSALELATNYSKHPLRFLAWLGFTASLVNLAYAGYVIAVNIVKGHVAEGWTTLSLQSATMFFLLFAILAILCEYVGRILEESRKEPQYHILDELNSKISVADATRRNITR